MSAAFSQGETGKGRGRQMRIIAALEKAAAEKPDLLALYYPDYEQTFAELIASVRLFAAALKANGVKPGDRVGLLIENGIEANVTLLGLSYLGAIVVPLFSGFGVDAIVARLSSCTARMLVASTGFSRRGNFVDARAIIEAARQQLPTIEKIIWKHSPEGSPAVINRRIDDRSG